MDQTSPTWHGPIERVKDHQEPDLPKVEREVRVMSSKLTDLTESLPSVPPPSVLCGSDILSQWLLLATWILPKRMMIMKRLRFLILLVTSFWQKERIFFNITIQDIQSVTFALLGRSHVIILDHQLPTSEGIYGVGKMGLLRKSSQFMRPLPLMVPQGIPIKRDVAGWTNVGGPILVGGRPIYSSPEVPISRINTEGGVKRIRKISDSPPDPDAEGSDELDGEEAEVVHNSACINPVLHLPILL
ncbi:hypothetical protein O181_024974 [Austropuccinia psidii MF-1]|uniref:Uncharacterized protein n=1 Tax=Austropuccinia psidii MF-1 TaxID=1389203 RepID=A0A9Q3H068_9BASI|nr:hypothetical protein [Austropuccinia psidii MF-1]